MRQLIRLGIGVLLVVGEAGCPADPPGDGVLVITARMLTAPKPADVSALRFSVERVDVVHRATETSVEKVLTVSKDKASFELRMVQGTVQDVAVLPVPPGFVDQVRFITGTVQGVRGRDLETVKLPSGEQTGLKLVPEEGTDAFPIETAKTTFVEAQLDAPERLIENRGIGLLFKPTVPTRLVSLGAVRSPVVPGRVVVKFAAGTSRSDIDSVINSLSATIFQEGIANYFILTIPDTVTIDEVAGKLGNDKRVLLALPDFYDVPRQVATPNDTLYATQQANIYAGVGASTAWTKTNGSREVVAAVVDEGFDIDHPDLVDNVWINVGELPSEFKSGFTADCDRDGVTTFPDLNCAACKPDPDQPGRPAAEVCEENIEAARSGACKRDSRVCIPAGAITPSVLVKSLKDGDSDGNGYPDDIIGWDFASNDNDPGFTEAELKERATRDPEARHHGTEIAGTVVAVTNNNLNVAGTAWFGRVALIRADTTGTQRNAFVYASQKVNADVVNYSRGVLAMAVDPPATNCGEARSVLRKSQGDINAKAKRYLDDLRSLEISRSLFVVSGANCDVDIDREDTLDVFAETKLSNFISVTTGIAGQAFGPTKMDIAGLSHPGAALAHRSVVSSGQRTFGPGSFGISSSFAAAYVSGTAMLVLSARSELRGNPGCLRALLMRNARGTGFKPTVAGGMLNMGAAVNDTQDCP